MLLNLRFSSMFTLLALTLQQLPRFQLFYLSKRKGWSSFEATKLWLPNLKFIFSVCMSITWTYCIFNAGGQLELVSWLKSNEDTHRQIKSALLTRRPPNILFAQPLLVKVFALTNLAFIFALSLNYRIVVRELPTAHGKSFILFILIFLSFCLIWASKCRNSKCTKRPGVSENKNTVLICCMVITVMPLKAQHFYSFLGYFSCKDEKENVGEEEERAIKWHTPLSQLMRSNY